MFPTSNPESSVELYRLEVPVAVLVQKKPEFVTLELLCFASIRNTLIVERRRRVLFELAGTSEDNLK